MMEVLVQLLIQNQNQEIVTQQIVVVVQQINMDHGVAGVLVLNHVVEENKPDQDLIRKYQQSMDKYVKIT